MEVTRIVGAQTSFSFRCRTTQNEVVMLTVAHGSDTAPLPGGLDQNIAAIKQNVSDLYAMTAISQTVIQFFELKRAQPDSAVKLQLSGIHSKNPAANGAPVVTVATLALD